MARYDGAPKGRTTMRDSIFRGVATPEEAEELAASNVIKRLPPGAGGTRRLQQRYGRELVCVRYRESADGTTRYTTVELVVERRPLAPPEDLVRIEFGETGLRNQVKAAGGRWDPKLKLWRLPRAATKALRLQSRVTKPVQ
jgi:hypothetical protein